MSMTGNNPKDNDSAKPDTSSVGGGNGNKEDSPMQAMDTEDFDLDDLSTVEIDPSQERDSIGNGLSSLRSQMTRAIAGFTSARAASNDVEADRWLAEMNKIKTGIKAVTEYQTMLGAFDNNMMPYAKVVSSGTGSGSNGLSLSRRDLPKYQLLSNNHKPFPNEEAFESDEHFLRTFENVIFSSSQDIEKVWKRYIPLCLPFGDDVWTQSSLKNCDSWADARKMFKKHYGSKFKAHEYNNQVFTMTMKANESIGAYTNRFLQIVHLAGIPKDDPRVADRFLASLTSPVQTLTRLACINHLGRHAEESHLWTVENIADLARDVLGDDASKYGISTSLLPGVDTGRATSSRSDSNARDERRMKGKGRQAETSKPYPRTGASRKHFCKMHGSNDSHSTDSCYTLSKIDKGKAKAGPSTFGDNPCRFCRQPWKPGHKCQKPSVLAIASAKDDRPKDKDEQDHDHEDMAIDSFDCKYDSENRLEDA